MAVSIYSTPKKYEKYNPTSVAEYAAPLIAEAKAKGAQMTALGMADTSFTGFKSDEERFKESIGAIDKSKESLTEKIMKGEDVSGSEMMSLVKDYNKLYGASGKITKAKAEYGKYQKEMAEYAKNSKDYDPALVNYMSKKALDAYAENPDAGFNMSPVARTRDIQKQANEYAKTYLSNHTFTDEDYGAVGLVAMYDDDGTKTGRYQNTKTKVTYSGTEANVLAAQKAVSGSIMADNRNAMYINQYSAASDVKPEELLMNSVNNAINLNSIYKVDTEKSQFNMKGVPVDGGPTALADYNTGENKYFYTATTGSAKSAVARELEYSQIEDAGSKIMEYGVQDYSSSEIKADLNNMLKSIRSGTVEDLEVAVKLAKRQGLELTPEILNDPIKLEKFRNDANKALLSKADKSTDIGREGNMIAEDIEKNFYSKNEKARQQRDDWNSEWRVQPMAAKMLDQEMEYIRSESDALSAAYDVIHYAKKEGYPYDAEQLAKEIVRKTKFKWNGEGYQKGMEYYSKQMKAKKNSFNGSPTTVYKVQPGLKASEDNKLQETFAATMEIISRNPSSTTLGANSNMLFGTGIDNIDFNSVDFESFEIPNDGEFLVLNMSIPGTGDAKGTKRTDKVTIDLRSQEGMVAAAKLLDEIPDGDQKEMLRIRIESRGIAGGMPDRQPQAVAGSPTFKYSLDSDGALKLEHTDPKSGITKDVSLAYHADSAVKDIMARRPGLDKQINTMIAATKQKFKDEPAAVIDAAIEENIKAIAKANKINLQDTFLLLIASNTGTPEAKVEAIRQFEGLESHVKANAILSSKINKSYTDYTRVHQYARKELTRYGK